ncbi:MAG: glycosyltransferase family 4 protein [Lachnospiraceae bacterium]|nr:glycosyltransferase family 4 protein [Lachnospiraceae bacterium]
MKEKIIFWGTGKLGHAVLAFCEKINVLPDFFCDSASDLWGSEINGIKILSPQDIYQWKNQMIVFITCGRYAEVKGQLLENGVPENAIVIADGERAPEMLCRLSELLRHFISKADGIREENYKCLIDLSGGMVLGGVERWSYSLAEIVTGIRIKSAYLIPEHCSKKIADQTIPAMFVEKKTGIPIVDTMESILYSGADTVICNFPFEIMAGACMVKKYINPGLKVIAVLHNDEEIYYRALRVWGEYIDTCLTISTRTKEKLLREGFPSYKIRDLYWNVFCNGKIRRSYSLEGEPLRIGYAGRISIHQKRVDLLVAVGEKLKESHVEFCMRIAGTGEYEEELLRQIEAKGLEACMKWIGEVPHAHIMDFWKEQDICISCSEWEGHSISHSEAMAAGAVPVITDTSGATDDVKEGVNGFVVDIGDMDMLVERIVYLHTHRELLPQMGSQSIKKIMAKNRAAEPEAYWKALLVTGDDR